MSVRKVASWVSLKTHWVRICILVWSIRKWHRLWHLTPLLSFSPVSSATCWTSPSGHNVSFSVLFLFLYSPSSLMTSLPTHSSKPEPQGDFLFPLLPFTPPWVTQSSRVSSHPLCLLSTPTPAALVQERTTSHGGSWIMLLIISLSLLLHTHPLSFWWSNLSKIIIIIIIAAFIETLPHARHCSKYFMYIISYTFFKLQLYWGMTDK